MLSLMKRKVFCVLTLLIATPNSLNAANQTSPEELFTKCYESQNSQQPDKEPCEHALQFATLKNDKALLLSHLAILQFKKGQNCFHRSPRGELFAEESSGSHVRKCGAML